MDPVTPFGWHRLFIGGEPPPFFLEITFRIVPIYLFSVFALGFMGKRGRREMSPFECMVIIALGSATGDSMFYPEVPLLYAFVVIMIAGNLVAAIRPHLRGTPCRIASTDMKVVSAEAARGYYPDVVVSCGDPDGEPDECTESRPRLVVEILSPSTEAFDRGDKCVSSRRMESLQESVLVAQSARAVEVHGRREGEWTVTSYGPGDTVTLRSIELELPMAIIYEYEDVSL